MLRVRMSDDDMAMLVDVIEETEALDLDDVAEAIVQAMEFAGHDREAAHAIARYGIGQRPVLLEALTLH
ncbi:MAG: hypothetical protein AB7O57_02860 [Hyphomicrobiaceae bacterium]